jgi:hypothetical protein
MPIGPHGQKRPTETHRCAIMVAKLSTGEIEEVLEPVTSESKTGHMHVQQRTKGKRTAKTRKVSAQD